jgi:hypothetical protein
MKVPQLLTKIINFILPIIRYGASSAEFWKEATGFIDILYTLDSASNYSAIQKLCTHKACTCTNNYSDKNLSGAGALNFIEASRKIFG